EGHGFPRGFGAVPATKKLQGNLGLFFLKEGHGFPRGFGAVPATKKLQGNWGLFLSSLGIHKKYLTHSALIKKQSSRCDNFPKLFI
ncbi:MAG: hypothetical protein CVT96_04970, partial [Bacteroidetes bacterium HGW-Bacteroidetes-13]